MTGFDPQDFVREAEQKRRTKPQPEKKANGHDRTSGFSDIELASGEVAEPIYIVPEIGPEGLTIVAGRPKVGKTSFCMNLADAVARGGMALGMIDCPQAEVLFLALEDNRRRLRRRRRQMLEAEGLQATPGLRFELEWPRLDEGGLDKLDQTCAGNPNIKLIVIDTWKKICPRRQRNQDDYEHENNAAGLLQKLAAKHQIAIIIVHHSRKGPGAEDFVDDVLGSTGLTGAVDTIIGFRRKRGTSDAEIAIAGRDVEECEKALAGDHTTGLWRLLPGSAADHRMSHQRQSILELLKDGKIRSIKEIADLLGEQYHNIRVLLAKLVDQGKLKKVAGGYCN